MKPLILKFGGSSLGDSDKIFFIARKIAALKRSNPRIICVLSAPADLTDNLLALSSKFTDNIRERDALAACGEMISVSLMAMALEKTGVRAVSLNAFQAGIYSDSNHSNASINKIDPRRINAELAKGRVAVVAGFQGISPAGDLTTLGRGGSDLSAVAIAKFLKGDRCHLYSDVTGVYTANPAIVPDAKKIKIISYREMIDLYKSGTEVRQLKALQLAQKNGIAIYLASSFSSEKGTLISTRAAGSGVSCLSLKHELNFARITLIGRNLELLGNIVGEIRKIAEKFGFNTADIRVFSGKIEILTEKKNSFDFLRALHKKFIG